MFKKGNKIVYPKHGTGKIIDILMQKIGKEEQKYYKITFFNSPVIVFVPVGTAEELGLRYPLSKTELKKAMKRLNDKIAIDRKTLITLDAITKKKLTSGRIEDVIELVNILKSLAKQKEEENKNFSYSYSDRLEIALDFIKSEISLVLGENALKRYEIF
jgi:CarD family transcriptional regulator